MLMIIIMMITIILGTGFMFFKSLQRVIDCIHDKITLVDIVFIISHIVIFLCLLLWIVKIFLKVV